jgi:hypothetical protein
LYSVIVDAPDQLAGEPPITGTYPQSARVHHHVPDAVASTGPAIVGRPQASAAKLTPCWSCEPPGRSAVQPRESRAALALAPLIVITGWARVVFVTRRCPRSSVGQLSAQRSLWRF